MNGDIRPFSSPLGGHFRTENYPKAAAATYGYGEWVAVPQPIGTGAQEIAEAAAAVNFLAGQHFIAASPFVRAATNTQVRVDRVGDGRYVDGPNTAVIDAFHVVDDSVEFVTRFLFTTTDALVTPTAAHVNEICGMHNATAGVAADRHGLDTAGTGLIITRVLDAKGVDLALSGATGVWCVFKKVLA